MTRSLYCLLFEFYSLFIQYGKKKIKYIDYKKQHLYFYMCESPGSHIPYHPISLKQTVVKPKAMTEIFPQRDQFMSYCDREKAACFISYLLGWKSEKENRKANRHS